MTLQIVSVSGWRRERKNPDKSSRLSSLTSSSQTLLFASLRNLAIIREKASNQSKEMTRGRWKKSCAKSLKNIVWSHVWRLQDAKLTLVNIKRGISFTFRALSRARRVSVQLYTFTRSVGSDSGSLNIQSAFSINSFFFGFLCWVIK